MRRTRQTTEEVSALKRELSSTRAALSQAYSRFNYTVEPELVDACVYEIRSIESRYSYLLRALRQTEAAGNGTE